MMVRLKVASGSFVVVFPDLTFILDYDFILEESLSFFFVLYQICIASARSSHKQ